MKFLVIIWGRFRSSHKLPISFLKEVPIREAAVAVSQMFAIFITNFHVSYNTYILHSRQMMQLPNTYIIDMKNKLGGIKLSAQLPTKQHRCG